MSKERAKSQELRVTSIVDRRFGVARRAPASAKGATA